MFIKLYLIAFTSFLAVDMVWLVFIAKNFYAKYLGHLMSSSVNWLAAIIFYLLFIVGIVVFVTGPSLSAQSWTKALLLGGLFGMIAYATYDLTNLATLKNWSLLVTVVDIIWGTTLSASVSLITYFMARKIGL